jgi:hypothetical protein
VIKREEIIQAMISAIVANNLLPANIIEDRDLVNTFTSQTGMS